MKSKNAIVACASLILVAVAVVVRSNPMETSSVATPDKRVMSQPQPTESRLSRWDRLRGYFSGTGNEEEDERDEKQLNQGIVPESLPSQEAKHLKDIAAKLSITVPDDDSPDNIAFLIKQRLDNSERYRGAVLSDENARDVKAQILEQSDAEAFEDYHAFIKGIENKKILILDTNE